MAATPLYKRLKSNGTTFYAFPGSSEDISSSYQNHNYKMYFTKYALLNFPKQDLTGTASKVVMDFENTFKVSSSATPATNFSDQIVESLRNYVANYEVVMKESKLNNTEFFYNNQLLGTPTEKIFWKWSRSLGLIDFERAVPGDEYFDNLPEFARNNINDDKYFPEVLWKEREVTSFRTVNFQDGSGTFSAYLEVELSGSSNFKVGDKVKFENITNSTVLTDITLNQWTYVDVYAIIPAGLTQGQKIVLNTPTSVGSGPNAETTGTVKLVYNRFVNYIGEVNGINNVAEANRSYTQVYAHIPDHTGKTPDILFRTRTDGNYKPNLQFPILPSQYQPEIFGAELFSSPIVSNPQNYPGSYYGQFDTLDFTYETSSGDILRRSGDYFGVKGDMSSPVYDGAKLDGLTLDFDRTHYVKMNILNREINNFDQFNALGVNGNPPEDFEFNAIAWFYTVEDSKGNKTNNLYGITFLDHPDNNPKTSETSIRIAPYKKYATTSYQDGTSYQFSLNLNFNIINENTQDAYNPSAINSLFSMSLFNQAMKKLSSTNDSFNVILADNTGIKADLSNMKQLLYSQNDFNVINAKISYLESLLNLYKSNQLISSDTIEVELNNTSNPPFIQLNSIDTNYTRVDRVFTTDLYSVNGIVPLRVSVPSNKNFLIHVINNDETEFNIGTDKLTVIIDGDLNYKQSFDIHVTSNSTSTQNKKLDIYIKHQEGPSTELPIDTPLITGINLPIFWNIDLQLPNSAKTRSKFNFDVDVDRNMILNIGRNIELPLIGNPNIITNNVKTGDTIYLDNFIVDPLTNNNYSGQYRIDAINVSGGSASLNLDASWNTDLLTYFTQYPGTFSQYGTQNTILVDKPYVKYNKGVTYRVTRVMESQNTSISDRYLIQKIEVI